MLGFYVRKAPWPQYRMPNTSRASTITRVLIPKPKEETSVHVALYVYIQTHLRISTSPLGTHNCEAPRPKPLHRIAKLFFLSKRNHSAQQPAICQSGARQQLAGSQPTARSTPASNQSATKHSHTPTHTHIHTHTHTQTSIYPPTVPPGIA